MTIDYYKVLEVEGTATPQVITAAYRRLAMRWHPDRHLNPAEKPAAERKFKAIQEAYDTLSDETKRHRYNVQRGFTSPRSQPSGEESVSERWRRHEAESQQREAESQRRHAEAESQRQAEAERQRAEADRRRRASLPKGRDVNAKRAITLDEAMTGCSLLIERRTVVVCHTCNGKGKTVPSCVYCNSKGYLGTRTCTQCSGALSCATCNGAGKAKEVRPIRLRIPAGVVNGSILTAEGRGQESAKGGLPGDLVVTLAVKAPVHWSVKRADLHGPLKIPFSVAMIGGDVDVELPTGRRLTVKIPPHTNSGAKIRLVGQGLFSAKTGSPGDAVLLASIVLPKAKRRLTSAMEALLRELDG